MDAGTPPRMVYRFDRFTLDLARGALLGPDGAELPLRPKSFALLRFFVENAGRLLDRDTIMAAVWPDLFVTDDSIAQCIGSIRRALGDEAQCLLRTVPKRGYLFTAEVSLPEPVMAPPRAARRLAAILAADVVGYSRLMEQDEQGTLERLKAHRKEFIEPLLAEHRGRIVNLAGDGALCEFASVVEAVACAVAIQAGMAGREPDLPEAERIRFRIGINVGDVIVEGEDIYGDGVNVAARLEAQAEPGGVCVSGQVRDAVLGKLELGFEDLGELALKNIARPVRAWRVAAEPARRVAGLPLADPPGDPPRHAHRHGPGEGIVVELARFRRGEPPASPAVRQAPAESPSPVAEHNLPQPNPTFVGRTAELEALRQALTATGRSAITQSRRAISGLGGIGKTQLALAYAYAHLGGYDLIRWLRAEEPAVLAADYTGMAPALGLDPGMPDQAALIAAIRAKLERMDRWLLVLDNAGEPGSLDPYLPRIGGGHVLITSRWQEWEGTAEALELAVLPEPEAVALLLGEGAADAAQHAAAAELAQELGRLPLALAQARAFMRARKVGIAGYRQQLAAARPKVLAWRPANAGYPLAMAQAWQASLDHAAHDCPAAGELLPLLAFLGPDAIPRDLLGAKPEALPEGLRDPFDRDGAVEALGRFSLIRVEPDSLTVHRLVQAVTREGLDEATSGRCATAAVALADAALPPPTWDSVHRPAIGRLFSQALAAASAAERFGVGLDGVGAILTVLGEYLYAGAAYAEAEPLLRRAVAAREQALGAEHPDLATPLHKLGNVCEGMGRPAEAELIYRRMVAVREQAYDPEHPLVAEGLGCLGLFLLSAGRRAEAEPIIARTLVSYERTIGPDHPDLAHSLFHMALLYQRTGRPAAAEPLYRRAIAVAEQAHEHRRVARYLDALAGLCRAGGRHAEAEPLHRRALAIREQSLGPEHPDLTTSLTNLAELYESTGRYAEAEPLYQRALGIRERTLGPEHPDVATSLNNLGLLYRKAGRHAEAEPLYQRALGIRERTLGPEHPDLATSVGQAGASAFAPRRSLSFSPPSTSTRVGGTSRSSRQRASIAARWPLANSPEWRMRWNPAGSTCSRKRRMNSPAARRISFGFGRPLPSR
jgi:class 3 adenylate cyclase/tetratricopeptide (TPR) repeat protein